MKSIALIVWLVAANGHEEVVARSHVNSMEACAAKATSYAQEYGRGDQKTRHLCHEVVEEYGNVDENGNPITNFAGK